MPVAHNRRLRDVRVDTPLENLGKPCRLEGRFSEIPAKMNTGERGNVSQIEKDLRERHQRLSRKGGEATHDVAEWDGLGQ